MNPSLKQTCKHKEVSLNFNLVFISRGEILSNRTERRRHTFLIYSGASLKGC